MTNDWRDQNLILPINSTGITPIDLGLEEMHWINDLGPDTFVALFMMWPSMDGYQLPLGHDLYVVSFNFEPFDVDWIQQQSLRIDAPIIVLNEGSAYDFPLPQNVYFFPFYTWHIQIERILHFHPKPTLSTKPSRYLCSAICSRLTQSKILIFSAMVRFLGLDRCLLKLGTWLEPKNVHFWHDTGDAEIDDLIHYFRDTWLGRELKVDDWVDERDNNYRSNSDPWQPFYLDSALHFTNESYHYSFMSDQWGAATRPGPNISEKTMKPLIAGTAMIPVGQFDTYRTLSDLGFVFDYGELDLEWDKKSGNLDRLRGIMDLIRSLHDYQPSDIDVMTKFSRQHNQSHVFSGDLRRRCEMINDKTVAEIFKQFGTGS
jgi:hypothetical protein